MIRNSWNSSCRNKNSIDDNDGILFAVVLELEEFLKNSWTTAVLGLAGDAQFPVLLTAGLVDVTVAVVTDDVTLIK